MVLVIGHRGAKGHEPENTLRAFKKAIDLGVDMVELDVHRCASGEIVVIHDFEIEGLGRVSELTLIELKSVDVGEGEEIPTLEEVLDYIGKRLAINIELKAGGYEKEVKEIIDAYEFDKNSVVISSFDLKALRTYQEIDESRRLGVLCSENFEKCLEFAEDIGAYSMHVVKELVNEEVVRRVRDKGMKIFVFTVNKVDEIARMKALGVDGIFSDFPERVK